MEERLKSDSLFTDIMMNATDYVFGEIAFNDFMSGHNFYYHWFRSFNFDRCNFLNIIFAEELNNLIYETTKNSQNIAQSKEDLRIKNSNLLETINECN